MTREAFHCVRPFIGGGNIQSANTIEIRDVERQRSAEAGSERLLLALFHYGSRHGLPNLSSDWCAAQLPPPAPVEPRKKPADNAWTRSEDAAVLYWRGRGLGYGRIAHRVPGRSASAVASRLRVLRLRSVEDAR